MSADEYAAHEPIPELHRQAVPALPDQLPALRNALTAWAMNVCLGPERIEALRLASYEAMANTVEHAYPRDQTGVLDVHAAWSPQRGTVTVIVTDYGRWRPVPANPGPLRGRGLPLIRKLADETHFVTGPNGTAVRMIWTVCPRSADDC